MGETSLVFVLLFKFYICGSIFCVHRKEGGAVICLEFASGSLGLAVAFIAITMKFSLYRVLIDRMHSSSILLALHVQKKFGSRLSLF